MSISFFRIVMTISVQSDATFIIPQTYGFEYVIIVQYESAANIADIKQKHPMLKADSPSGMIDRLRRKVSSWSIMPAATGPTEDILSKDRYKSLRSRIFFLICTLAGIPIVV